MRKLSSSGRGSHLPKGIEFKSRPVGLQRPVPSTAPAGAWLLLQRARGRSWDNVISGLQARPLLKLGRNLIYLTPTRYSTPSIAAPLYSHWRNPALPLLRSWAGATGSRPEEASCICLPSASTLSLGTVFPSSLVTQLQVYQSPSAA